ncbi:MAG: prepilin-type N-terminal cleavage/methylation domain-containing protein, partial [Gemmatimonadaceae bacterium]
MRQKETRGVERVAWRIVRTRKLPRNSMKLRAGVSFIELLLVLVIVGVLMTLALPPFIAVRDRAAVN